MMNSLFILNQGGGGGGKRRGLGPRNDVLTTCKAITLRDGQRIIAAFFLLLKSLKIFTVEANR